MDDYLLERERCLELVARVVESYVETDDGRISLRKFAEILNSGHNKPSLNVSYQTVKNWLDAVYLPRQKWLDDIEDYADEGSVVKLMSREIFNAIWSVRSR